MNQIVHAHYSQPNILNSIDQTEMGDQIFSYFSYNILLAIRGLRIQTANELNQQLSYLQHANVHNSNNNNNNNYNLSNSSQYNSNNNFSGFSNQNWFRLPHNNYNRQLQQ